MIQKTKLIDHLKGDTFEKLKFELYITDTSTPIILTDATIKMQFRIGSKNGRKLLELTNGGGLTVTDALNGKFDIDRTNTFLTIPHTYFYDIEVTFITGEIKTYLEGTINIKQDTSY